eukprot:4681082-Heterocapsa_arctica.AAC.1
MSAGGPDARQSYEEESDEQEESEEEPDEDEELDEEEDEWSEEESFLKARARGCSFGRAHWALLQRGIKTGVWPTPGGMWEFLLGDAPRVVPPVDGPEFPPLPAPGGPDKETEEGHVSDAPRRTPKGKRKWIPLSHAPLKVYAELGK